jgi:arylsulfatase A-like enzyme
MSEKRPNILLITSDQHHYSALGAVNSLIKTPNLDRLCKSGTRFDRAYCPNPTCTPTRASILTGMYPSQHGAWSLGTKLFEDVPTVSEALSKGGYTTSLIGKAHFQPTVSLPGMESIECQPKMLDLDFWRRFHGPWYGFDYIEISRGHTNERNVGQHYAAWMEDSGLKNWKDYFVAWPLNPNEKLEQPYGRGAVTWDLPEEYHYTPWTADRTIARIDNALVDGKPFFIWSSFHDPHPSYVVPEPWASMYDPADMPIGHLVEGEHEKNPIHFRKTQEEDPAWWEKMAEGEVIHGGETHVGSDDELKKSMAAYYGMVSFMDKHIGRILDHLDEQGLTENTIIIFTTDHGHFLGQHGLVAKAIHHYEDLLKIPFIVSQPGVVPADKTTDSIINLVDLAPTFLALAGLDIPGIMTGLDQRETFAGGLPVRTWSVTENHHGTRNFHMRTYVNARYKITVYRDGVDGELFDLQEDPNEINNLWHNADATALKGQLLHEFMQATLQSEPMRMPRIAGA